VDPLAALVNDTPSIKVLSSAKASAFLKFLQDRVRLSESNDEDTDMDDDSPSSTINAINTSRTDFRRRMINMILGFQLMILLQSFLEEQGYRGLDWSPDLGKRGGLCTAMLHLLEGHLGKDVKQLGMIAR
jgi:origin recognition complex subunit 3